MIKAVLIDDEPLARDLVLEYLQTHPDISVVATCEDGLSGIKAIQAHQPDLIFLDIQMPKITGFEMLELLDEVPSVIFTTAFEEFAIQAFEVNAIDYLLKPFSKDRFDKAIHRLQERSRSTPSLTQLLETAASDLPVHHHRVVVKSNGKIIIIPTTDIQFLEASDDYVRIKSSQGVFLKNRTMAHFEKTFDPKHFIRVHRSYMVNVSEIAKIENGDKDSWIILLKQGGHIPVSKSGYSKLRSALGL